MRGRVLVLAALLVLGPAACRTGARAALIKLDGSPHPATDSGIITKADRQHVVVDGKRTYTVDPRLVVFAPGTLQLIPLTTTVGRYALLGAKASRVEWIEALTFAVTLPGGKPTVYFFGTLSRFDQSTLTFGDGTVLPAASDVTKPDGLSLPQAVRADIDPDTHLVTAFAGG